MIEYISKKRVKDFIHAVNSVHGFTSYEDYVWILSAVIDTPAANVRYDDQWISVNDRLPDSGQNVLIHYPYWDGDEIQVAKLDDDKMTFDVCGEFNVPAKAVTHWKRLPEPPK